MMLQHLEKTDKQAHELVKRMQALAAKKADLEVLKSQVSDAGGSDKGAKKQKQEHEQGQEQ